MDHCEILWKLEALATSQAPVTIFMCMLDGCTCCVVGTWGTHRGGGEEGRDEAEG